MSDDFISLAYGRTHWVARRGYENLFHHRGLREILALGETAAARPVGDSKPSSRVKFVVTTENAHGEAVDLFVKFIGRPPGGNYLGQLFRASAARREFERANEALARGVPVARPVAWGERRVLGATKESVYVAAALADTQSVRQYVKAWWAEAGRRNAAEKRVLARALGRFVGEIHQRGLCHPDLQLKNVLVRLADQADGPPPALFVVDLDEVRFTDGLTDEERLSSLARLSGYEHPAISKADRLRVLHSYLQEAVELKLDARAVCHEIESRR